MFFYVVIKRVNYFESADLFPICDLMLIYVCERWKVLFLDNRFNQHMQTFRLHPKYADKPAWENNVDPDPTLSAVSDWGSHSSRS